MNSDLMNIAYEDIVESFYIWKDITINDLSIEIEYIYVKSSSIKEWKSDIDYVPMISDVYIRFKYKFPWKNPFPRLSIKSY